MTSSGQAAVDIFIGVRQNYMYDETHVHRDRVLSPDTPKPPGLVAEEASVRG